MKIPFILSFLFLSVMFFALGVEKTAAQIRHKKMIGPIKKITAVDLEVGKGLLSKSDCLSCHKLDVKVVGPAYKDVTAKYSATEANYKMLTQKIIKGGSGNWGTTAMSAHPTLAPADVRKMVAYILSVK